ncbi:hypothetical protein NW766_000885 [Fusarium irregulare]|uniref:Uncharacterized protein n=1 Tax=Fusarium irregulare TaxID=2494466 RepID=A0A9W8Q0M8_9HYPO|nr:hypothetical protein NW766_000885 [Fusarium irregulare]
MNLDISHFGSMSTENVAWLDYAGFESPESNSSVSGSRNDNAAFENGKASYSRISSFHSDEGENSLTGLSPIVHVKNMDLAV